MKKIQNKFSLPVKKEAPCCICMEASYTAEVVVVVPLFVAFMVMLLFFFRVLQVQQEVGSALMDAAREMAVYSYAEETISTNGITEAKLLFLAKYKNGEADDFIDGGKLGISLRNSDLSGEYVDLKAEYALSLPVGFFGKQSISISQRAKCRKWTGRAEDTEKEAELVYITPAGEAYHQNKNCRYLDLSIQPVAGNQVSKQRNKDGEKYYACPKCMRTTKKYNLVYVTDYGNRYHGRLDCSDLKRTVIAVRISEVGSRRSCSKCGRENL